MATIKLRRGQSSTFASNNPILAEGEPAFELDTGKLKIGNGVDAYNDLDYISGSPAGGDTSSGVTEEELDERLDGLSFKAVTQTEYDALETKDPMTFYFITDSSSYNESEIDDSVTGLSTTWSSNKINTELNNKASTSSLGSLASMNSIDYTSSYLTNKPTIPTVNNSTVTITQNGSTVGSFTTNQSSSSTIDITTSSNGGGYVVGSYGLQVAQNYGFDGFKDVPSTETYTFLSDEQPNGTIISNRTGDILLAGVYSSSSKYRYIARSTDQGKTWSKVEIPYDNSNQICEQWAFSYNSHEDKFYIIRTKYGVISSYDGLTWETEFKDTNHRWMCMASNENGTLKIATAAALDGVDNTDGCMHYDPDNGWHFEQSIYNVSAGDWGQVVYSKSTGQFFVFDWSKRAVIATYYNDVDKVWTKDEAITFSTDVSAYNDCFEAGEFIYIRDRENYSSIMRFKASEPSDYATTSNNRFQCNYGFRLFVDDLTQRVYAANDSQAGYFNFIDWADFAGGWNYVQVRGDSGYGSDYAGICRIGETDKIITVVSNNKTYGRIFKINYEGTDIALNPYIMGELYATVYNMDGRVSELEKNTVGTVGFATEAAEAAAPYGYKSLTVPSSGTSITAPYNGYIQFQAQASAADAYVKLNNDNCSIADWGWATAKDRYFSAMIPVRKGQKVTPTYRSCTNITFRLMYTYDSDAIFEGIS